MYRLKRMTLCLLCLSILLILKLAPSFNIRRMDRQLSTAPLHHRMLSETFRRSSERIPLDTSESSSAFRMPTERIPLKTPGALLDSGYGKTVLIMAYHRTGSTLTGATLKLYPGSFYVFEPLRAIDDIYKRQHFLTLMNGTKIVFAMRDQKKVYKEALENWINCRLDLLHVETFMDHQHITYNDSLSPFPICVNSSLFLRISRHNSRRTKPSTLPTNTSFKFFDGHFIRLNNNSTKIISNKISTWKNLHLEEILLKCLQPVQNQCKTAPLRALKMIRLRMNMVANIMQTYKNVRLIHLVRDPRGNIISQAALLENTSFSNITKEYCRQVRDDIIVKESLQQNHPDRIFTLRYESFADSPMKMARKLYSFVNITFATIVEYFIQNATEIRSEGGACLDGGDVVSYCVRVGDSSMMASSWRQWITAPELFQIQDECTEVFKKLRLVYFDNIAHVRDMARPSYIL